MAKMFTSKTELTCTQIADAADRMVRERLGDAYEVLYEGRDVQGVVVDLMTRAKRSEHDESWS